jgi:aerobic-type carbon monoxide dehydrogenase small subunit (CoxS/CutS family)
MTRITLNVNGAETQVDAPDDMPLLWALRDLMGLTGSKYWLRHRSVRCLHGTFKWGTGAQLLDTR